MLRAALSTRSHWGWSTTTSVIAWSPTRRARSVQTRSWAPSGACYRIDRRTRSRGAMPSPDAQDPLGARVTPGVQRFDLVGKVLRDDLSPQLHGRRDLVFLRREVTRQDREALHLLERRLVAVPVVHDLLDGRLYLRAVADLGRFGLVQRDQCGEIGPAVADHERL